MTRDERQLDQTGATTSPTGDGVIQDDLESMPRQVLGGVIAAQPDPLVFVTISGAHLYGFASHDSDYDLRGVHVLPVREVCGLFEPRDTISYSSIESGLEIDLVTHDVAKFFRMLLKRNGYVLEQVLSPLVLHTSPEHDELRSIALDCVTRNHAHHYFGFARRQWKLFETERRVKPLLYTYRVLLTGIYLMRTGLLEANLVRLNASFRLGMVDELLELKIHGSEKQQVGDVDIEFHRQEIDRLTRELEVACDESVLPEHATGRAALNDLLLRLRMRTAKD